MAGFISVQSARQFVGSRLFEGRFFARLMHLFGRSSPYVGVEGAPPVADLTSWQYQGAGGRFEKDG